MARGLKWRCVTGLEAHAALQRVGAASARPAGHGAAAALLAAVPAPAEARWQPAAREPAAPEAVQESHHPRLQDPGRGYRQHVSGLRPVFSTGSARVRYGACHDSVADALTAAVAGSAAAAGP